MLKSKKLNHAAIIPLIGGFSIAATEILQNPPKAIFSYSPFFENDKLYLNYLAQHDIYPTYYQLDKIDESKYSDIKNIVGELDIVHGVPPCAGLSMSGNLAKGARSKSPVNDWMYKAADFILGVIQPKIYVYENAPTLFTGVGEYVRSQLMEKAKSNGYACTFYKTDTLLHGIPQRRPRTYIVFVKGNKAPILDYYNKEHLSVSEYLKMIPECASMQNEYSTKEPFIKDFEIVKFCEKIYGDKWREEFIKTKEHLTSYDFLNRNGLIEQYREYVYSLPDAHPASKKDIDHVIKKLGMGKNFRLSHRVLCIDKNHIYAVVGEMMERNVHPTEDRRINIREYMHMMGMPHDFEITGPKDYSKIPQNCPVTTSKDIISEAVAIIKGERQFSNHEFMMQDNIKYIGIKSKQLF